MARPLRKELFFAASLSIPIPHASVFFPVLHIEEK